MWKLAKCLGKCTMAKCVSLHFNWDSDSDSNFDFSSYSSLGRKNRKKSKIIANTGRRLERCVWCDYIEFLIRVGQKGSWMERRYDVVATLTGQY